MLRNRKRLVERMAANAQLRRQMVHEYGAFLRTLFSVGDWFVTLTFRDRCQDSEHKSSRPVSYSPNFGNKKHERSTVKCSPDPRIEAWEPDSRYRREPGPPVRDAALREIEHWLIELGWEAAGHNRQEILDHLAHGLYEGERRNFLRSLRNKCLCCRLLWDPVTFHRYEDIRKVATAVIGWVIAEEFGRAGGRWHVHLLVRGVPYLRRKKWWKRAFTRFGRSRIEPIHG
jgi:hypothetical protein